MVGRFINKIGPIVSIASYCLGGVGGIIGKVVSYSNKIYNAYNGLPGLVFNNVVSSPIF